MARLTVKVTGAGPLKVAHLQLSAPGVTQAQVDAAAQAALDVLQGRKTASRPAKRDKTATREE